MNHEYEIDRAALLGCQYQYNPKGFGTHQLVRGGHLIVSYMKDAHLLDDLYEFGLVFNASHEVVDRPRKEDQL